VRPAARLARLERRAPEPAGSEAEIDAEIEQLAAELEEREGPGAFATLLAEIEREMTSA
jgi:hypothetical protein